MAHLPRSSIARRRVGASQMTTLSKRASANRSSHRAITNCPPPPKLIRGRNRTSTSSSLPLLLQLRTARRILSNWTLPSNLKSRKINPPPESNNNPLTTKPPSTKVSIPPRRRLRHWPLNPRLQVRKKRNLWIQRTSLHIPTILAIQNRCTPTLSQSLRSPRRPVFHQVILTRSIRTCGLRFHISVGLNIRISLQWLMGTASMEKRSVISSNKSCPNTSRHKCDTCSRSILRIYKSTRRMRHSTLMKCVLHSTMLSSTAMMSSFQE